MYGYETAVAERYVLDYGHVKLLNVASQNRRDCMMQNAPISERDIADAARVSFDKRIGDRTEDQDLKLADYLYRNQHMSPFEMVQIWFEVKMPIFVARQFVRHRTSSINEVSGRYVTLPEEWYIPESVGSKPVNNKQGRGLNVDVSTETVFKRNLNQHCSSGYKNYLNAIESGVCPEQARMFLSLNHYTKWLWRMDLRNFLHFIQLRTDKHAQFEAREYANAMLECVETQLPHIIEIFKKYN